MTYNDRHDALIVLLQVIFVLAVVAFSVCAVCMSDIVDGRNLWWLLLIGNSP